MSLRTLRAEVKKGRPRRKVKWRKIQYGGKSNMAALLVKSHVPTIGHHYASTFEKKTLPSFHLPSIVLHQAHAKVSSWVKSKTACTPLKNYAQEDFQDVFEKALKLQIIPAGLKRCNLKSE